MIISKGKISKGGIDIKWGAHPPTPTPVPLIMPCSNYYVMWLAMGKLIPWNTFHLLKNPPLTNLLFGMVFQDVTYNQT